MCKCGCFEKCLNCLKATNDDNVIKNIRRSDHIPKKHWVDANMQESYSRSSKDTYDYLCGLVEDTEISEFPYNLLEYDCAQFANSNTQVTSPSHG